MLELRIKKTPNFSVNGLGDDPAWNMAEWQKLQQVGGMSSPYSTRFKTLYSDTGMYFLVDCEDKQLTCRERKDFDDIWQDDVVEVFLWTDETQDYYFEYEISPLEKELVLMVANNNGQFMGWQAWHFENERKTQKAVSVRGGKKELMGKAESWTAEFFIPFELLKGFNHVPPKQNMTWRANVYRMDYDSSERCQWAWSPAIGCDFHNYKNFGRIVFK